MTQFARTALNPSVHGGTFLSTELNSWAPAVLSTHKGASRPSYAVDGMLFWKEVSATVVELRTWDGSGETLLGTWNPVTDTFVPAGVSSGIPVGAVQAFAGSAVPSLWLLCSGQAVSRTTYAALFTAIGTTYGVGNGSTTFNVPDLRGRVPAGVDNMGGTAANRLTSTVMSPNGNSLGATGGSQTHILSVAEMPSHTHTTDSILVSLAGGGGVRELLPGSTTPTTTQVTSSAGSGSAHNNTQPTLLFNYCIYAGV